MLLASATDVYTNVAKMPTYDELLELYRDKCLEFDALKEESLNLLNSCEEVTSGRLPIARLAVQVADYKNLWSEHF